MHSLNSILARLLEQIAGYNTTLRKTVQPYILARIQKEFPKYQLNFDDEIVRETLAEHVGSLPIIAAYLHPYLSEKVDLGKVLIMLSIHDIGELKTGDVLTFVKPIEETEEEKLAAFELLHPSYHSLYEEMELGEINEAKFAKAIDKIAPDLLDIICGRTFTETRLMAQAKWQREDVIDKIQAKKRPFMTWSTFMTEFHDLVIQNLRDSN